MPNEVFALVKQQPAYQQFREAFARRKLPFVIVCGAGLSTPANLPQWSTLRKTLESQATTKVHSLKKLN